MEQKNEAIYLFKEKYGKTPKESGMPVIGIYEKQRAFLYAVSEEVIEAYKTQQNIIRWVMLWYVWPMILAMINLFFAFFSYQDVMHWRCWVSYVFIAVWGALLIVCWIRANKAGKLIKLGENITFLNYTRHQNERRSADCDATEITYSGLGKEPYWNEPLAEVSDYTEPRYVYADKFESVTPTTGHGRVIGYRISPTLVIHSMVRQDNNGIGNLRTIIPNFIKKFGGKMLTEDDIPVLRENWKTIDNMRIAIGDTTLPKYIIPFELPDYSICTTNIEDGRIFTGEMASFGSIIMKR